MCKFNRKWGDTRIDPCMRKFIKWLSNKHRVIACCCGHLVYSPTAVVKEYDKDNLKNIIIYREIFSGVVFAPRRKIYKRNKNGIYYIPEVEEYYKLQSSDKSLNSIRN